MSSTSATWWTCCSESELYNECVKQLRRNRIVGTRAYKTQGAKSPGEEFESEEQADRASMGFDQAMGECSGQVKKHSPFAGLTENPPLEDSYGRCSNCSYHHPPPRKGVKR